MQNICKLIVHMIYLMRRVKFCYFYSLCREFTLLLSSHVITTSATLTIACKWDMSKALVSSM